MHLNVNMQHSECRLKVILCEQTDGVDTHTHTGHTHVTLLTVYLPSDAAHRIQAKESEMWEKDWVL